MFHVSFEWSFLITQVQFPFSEDKVVTCRDFERLLYLDKKPVGEDHRTTCVPKMNTTLGDICFDESEQLIYKTGMLDDTRLRVDDLQARYCLVYTSDDAAEPKYCVSVNCHTLISYFRIKLKW